MMSANCRRGFTLVELMVVVVLGSILVMATYQVLATNTRVYAVNNARVQGQQALRGGIDILSGELREISTRGGDLISMQDQSLTIRAQRPFGLACAVDYSVSPPEITAFRVGPAFQAGDSVFVFHDNDPDRASDDEWFGGIVTSVDTTANCGGSPAQILSLPFLATTATASPPDSVRVGAPVRGFEIFTYGEVDVGGEPYLGRWSRLTPSPDILVGPLVPSQGLGFRYLDSMGRVTTVDTLVAQIEMTIRYQSALRDFRSEPVSDSILVRVYPRN
jgi:prepilin-type N-terminal cleavage/methylation domain-containing protein